ncbi:MAG TPA: 5-deoxy-glucuronate isomerase [Solirubrobacteraceae bacterium]|nr:5-deoxy-glucuronate isomerase [Solirubrobacteraceae bacterium]
MSTILKRPATDGTIVVTPESAGWTYVGFEAVDLAPGATVTYETGARETCVVVISGTVHVRSEHGDWTDLGGRKDPFSGPPEGAYFPPGSTYLVEAASSGPAEIGLCHAPASKGTAARALRSAEVSRRGYDVHERIVGNVMMANEDAERLLVTEVVTPSGHWSSYPPHKHDVDALPAESYLEETYYHRVMPATGFGLQRVYTDDRSLDETVAFADRDVVLVPRGYHTVAAPPGVAVYYLNVMAGPSREWAFTDDPALAWTRAEGATLDGRLGPSTS